MTIQDLGSIGELVAAIATVATLAYLALQIKHSKVSTTSANVLNAIQSFNPVNTAVGSDPDLARLFNRGVSDFASLDETERAQYGYIQRAYLNCYWNVFLQHKLGALSEDQWRKYAHEVAFALTMPGPRAFRESNRMYDEMFEAVEAMNLEADHVDLDLVATTPGPRAPAT